MSRDIEKSMAAKTTLSACKGAFNAKALHQNMEVIADMKICYRTVGPSVTRWQRNKFQNFVETYHV